MRKGLGISLENCEKPAATRDHVHMLEFGLCLVHSHFVPPGIKVRCTVRHCQVHVHVHVTEDVLYVICGMVTLLVCTCTCDHSAPLRSHPNPITPTYAHLLHVFVTLC